MLVTYYRWEFIKSIDEMASVRCYWMRWLITWPQRKNVKWKRYFYTFWPQISRPFYSTKKEGMTLSQLHCAPSVSHMWTSMVSPTDLECTHFCRIITWLKATVKMVSRMCCTSMAAIHLGRSTVSIDNYHFHSLCALMNNWVWPSCLPPATSRSYQKFVLESEIR